MFGNSQLCRAETVVVIPRRDTATESGGTQVQVGERERQLPETRQNAGNVQEHPQGGGGHARAGDSVLGVGPGVYINYIYI